MAAIDIGSLDSFWLVCLILAAVMLIWNTVEVGRNDAANLVNAVFGARVMRRRPAVILAGAAVVLGAVLSSDVLDTARKGIFDPTLQEGLNAALTIYISVYIVNTVLLYSYSSFGMPVSTTACLVFGLLGSAMAVGPDTIHWDNASRVMAGIVCSIVLSGIAGFLIQRAARGAIRDRTTHLATLLLHGGSVGGAIAAGLCYFMILKGMKNIGWVKAFQGWIHQFDAAYDVSAGTIVVILCLWAFFAILIHALLVIFRKRAARLLFPVLAVAGMIAMGFAFGQNDLANCASPGLAAYTLIDTGDVNIASKMPIHWWLLLICGLLLFYGMTTKQAQRVTKAEIATGSAGDHVALWAPRWCLRAASVLLRYRGQAPALAPRAGFTEAGKTLHFDTLRACVITAVSASVIATASSMGLPVSTTYVAFAAVVSTGMADRIFQRGDAELKLGRAIWVVSSWFISAAIAFTATFVVAWVVYRMVQFGSGYGVAAMAVFLILNLTIRRILGRRADALQQRADDDFSERADPDAYAREEDDA